MLMGTHQLAKRKSQEYRRNQGSPSAASERAVTTGVLARFEPCEESSMYYL